MKFIKDINGDFVRVDKIIGLEVYKAKMSDKWNVHANLDHYGATLKEFSNEAEARSWLNELVIQIDDELSGRNLTRDLWKQVTQLIKEKRHADTH